MTMRERPDFIGPWRFNRELRFWWRPCSNKTRQGWMTLYGYSDYIVKWAPRTRKSAPPGRVGQTGRGSGGVETRRYDSMSMPGTCSRWTSSNTRATCGVGATRTS